MRLNFFLFIDNFRGFKNAYIPITDVNFLVGQNSTGKTSVLGLIKLFSGPTFLMQQEFGDQHVSFGHFSDMVSAHSEDRSYFRIGVVWEATQDKKVTALAWLSTYSEHEGLPRLAKHTFLRGQQQISLEYDGPNIYYKQVHYEVPPTARTVFEDLLPTWVQEHSQSSSGVYEKLSVPPSFPRKLPLLITLGLIEGVRSTKKATSDTEAILNSPAAFFPADVAWIAPIRTKPNRTYDELTLAFSPEGEHTPYLIRRMLRSKPEATKFKEFIEKVGKASGLFQDIQIKSFGRGITTPFEVDVVLDDKALNLSTVGYGVSQALPVLVELLARPHRSWFAIQQPEVYLHPRAQAALGDVFFEMAVSDHKCFLVETHSDFTIDRFRMNYKSKSQKKPDSQILFFERRDKHNTVTPINISESGELPTDQPEGYRQFFMDENLRLLGVDG